MNGYKGWREATGELGQVVRSAWPHVALVVMMIVMLAVLMLLRFWIFLPEVRS